jgi:hypothetical protein
MRRIPLRAGAAYRTLPAGRRKVSEAGWSSRIRRAREPPDRKRVLFGAVLILDRLRKDLLDIVWGSDPRLLPELGADGVIVGRKAARILVLRLYRDVGAQKISLKKGYGDPKGQHPKC